MSKRAYKPTKLRALEGGISNSLPKPDKANEPQPRPKMLKCPRSLDKTAKKTWKTLAPILMNLGLLTEVDGGSLSDVCQTRARIIALRELLNDPEASMLVCEPRIDKDGGGKYEFDINGLIREERLQMELYRKQAGEFGLSPRGRVGLAVNAKDDDGADLI